ncbi:MAG: hypothetical protein AAGG44_12395 [Planctomycetota bacterium]
MLAIILEWIGNALIVIGLFIAIVAGIDYAMEANAAKAIAIAFGLSTAAIGWLLFRRRAKKQEE